MVKNYIIAGHKIFGSYVYKRLLLGLKTGNLDVIDENINGRLIDNVNNIHVDIIGNEMFETLIYQKTFITSLIYTSEEIQPSNASISYQDMDFVIRTVKNRTYCPWGDMRDKDKIFFSTFKKIPQNICDNYGYYHNNIGTLPHFYFWRGNL